MSITYLKDRRLFKLDTPHTTYVIGIVGAEGYLGHVYYGAYLDSITGIEASMRINEKPFTPDENERAKTAFLDSFPTEYAGHGVGDFRESAVRIKDVHGHSGVMLTYASYEIIKGKEKLHGLPATFAGKEEAATLKIYCRDAITGLEAVLSYTVFEQVDAIARSVYFTNAGQEDIFLEKAMSCCLDMDNRDFEVLTLHGEAARERHKARRKLDYGSFSISSVRGRSGHQDHPFMAVMTPGTTQNQGEVYGFHFVYSGNFKATAAVNQFNSLRVLMGIHPEDFSWKLTQGESFQTPEVILTYSDGGLSGMTANFHQLYRNHLIRSKYLHQKRPILINNWEATYFDFDTEKLLDIARESVALGIEMLVMDDGWFGNRFDDNRALGDWFVNEEKLPGGLKPLVEEINKLGMKFGIWFEPEMISEDSDLYREHPDWALSLPGRKPSLYRNQLVLDITRADVREHILQQMFKILHSANIAYVKWDMNRSLSDVGSAAWPTDRQGELYHRYVLGLYEMQERLLEEFPDLLLENCSAGGARFDPGMLYYSPQIWCSDNTDAIERLAIQESTAMLYPLSTMGAHVSVCPNHAMGRTTPFETRGMVALAGTFGYELDITKVSEEEKQMIARQVTLYHACNDIIREGDYYRLASYQENHLYDCFQINAPSGEESLVFYVQVLSEAQKRSRFIALQHLDKDADYLVYEMEPQSDTLWKEEGRRVSGDVLMKVGLQVERMKGDFQSKLFRFKKVERYRNKSTVL